MKNMEVEMGCDLDSDVSEVEELDYAESVCDSIQSDIESKDDSDSTDDNNIQEVSTHVLGSA